MYFKIDLLYMQLRETPSTQLWFWLNEY